VSERAFHSQVVNFDFLYSVNWQLMLHGCVSISTRVATAYDTLGESGLAHSLNEPECVGIFTNADLLPILSRVLKDTLTVRLVVYDGEPKASTLTDLRNIRDSIQVVHIDELRETGRGQLTDILESRRPGPDTVAYIMYTSGTTGPPKGVILTNSNLVASVSAVMTFFGQILNSEDTFLAYLPLRKPTCQNRHLVLPELHFLIHLVFYKNYCLVIILKC